MNRGRLHFLYLGLILWASVLFAGCTAPGSAIGILTLNGQIDHYTTSDHPLKVKVMLPKEYGLGGLDHVFGKPEDYGNVDRVEIKTVEPDGSFVFRHEIVYHITFFLLPPLGAVPKVPPPPIYLVGFSDCPDEVYWVDFKKKKPRYKVYQMPQKQEIPLDKARWTIFDGLIQEVEVEGRSAFDITLRFRKT